jgi:F0F1-type ATP synthase assembly protein I
MARDDTHDREQPIEDSSSIPEDVSGKESEPGSAEKKVGWIDSLAQRSSGLPGTSRPVVKVSDEKSPWRYAGIGLQILGTTLLFVWMGYELDKRMGWTPWGMVTLTMLSVIGSLYLLIKEVMKENADGPAPGPRSGKK